MNIKIAFAASLAAATLASGGAAQAASIQLFNTGVDAAGTPLPDGTIGDPHYSLVGVPSGTTDLRVRRAVGGFPIPPYVGDDSLSAWVGPNNDNQVDGPGGAYDYRTTFSLTGLNPASASITGQWATDNDGLNILINGVATGFTTPFTSFLAFSPFSITSGFHAGTNTLDFLVNNGGGPTALRVEMTGAADSAVPEPAAWALMLVGFGALGAFARAGRRQAVATA